MKKIFLVLGLLLVVCSSKPREMTWVAIGDSITYLNEHPDEANNRITKGYMTMVTEALPHIKYVNQGHNGWTSGGIAKNFDKLNVPVADVYSVFLGTNDWNQGRPLGTLNDYLNNTGNETVHGSYRLIIDRLKALNPNAHIILITPLQRSDFVYFRRFTNNAAGSYKPRQGQTLEQFAEVISAIAKHEGFVLVDLYHKRSLRLEKAVKFKRLKDPTTGQYHNYPYPEYTSIPFDPAKDEYPYPVEAIDMTYDGLHPSDKGYAVISKMLVKVMKKYE